MDDSGNSPAPLGGVASRVMHRLLAIGENRVQLLLVEVQEERNRLVDMVFMAIATAALGLLAGIVWSAALALFFWPANSAWALLILGAIYVAAGALTFRRLAGLRRNLQTLTATLEQLQKDAACLKQN